MAYNILLTSLYAANKSERIRYFAAKDGYRRTYCDAMLTVEASAKFVLAQYPVDEIITLGRQLTYDEGDDVKLIELAEGKDFYTADPSDLSTYSLFRYRIAQYIDELKIEQLDIKDQLDKDIQSAISKEIRKFFRERDTEDKHRKFNRLFDELSEAPVAYDELMTVLRENVPEAAYDPKSFESWVKNHLYEDLKDSCKMELLEGNEDVKVRFIPTSLSEDGHMPIDNMMQLVHSIISDREEDINLYVALNSDDLTDNFVLLNVLNIIQMMPGSRVNLKSIFTTTYSPGELAGEISNDVDVLGISELVSAINAFLKYGKSDMIVEFWERCGGHNEKVEQMIYAIRRIDIGISLCNIHEIESGIEELRLLFEGGIDLGGDDYYSRLYTVLAEAIKRDYGRMLEGDEIEFIDMVKWAASKSFYQQTLTLIESRAPKAFVDNGIYYYCDDESEKEHVTRLFAEFRNTLKPYEMYQMDDIEHYYIKIYARRIHKKKGNDMQKSYAGFRMSQLDNTDDSIVTAHTACEDRELLEDLLYAYYHIGDVRNKTNHADDREQDNHKLIVDQKDLPISMTQIKESIDFFIMKYDSIMEEIAGKDKEIVMIAPWEVKSMAGKLMQDEKGGEKDSSDR